MLERVVIRSITDLDGVRTPSTGRPTQTWWVRLRTDSKTFWFAQPDGEPPPKRRKTVCSAIVGGSVVGPGPLSHSLHGEGTGDAGCIPKV